MYYESMKDYLKSGHMRPVEPSYLKECYFLPHHGVIKENNNTMKLRTVFKTSTKTNQDFSIGDFLSVGPNLLPEIVDLGSKRHGYTYIFTSK